MDAGPVPWDVRWIELRRATDARMVAEGRALRAAEAAAHELLHAPELGRSVPAWLASLVHDAAALGLARIAEAQAQRDLLRQRDEDRRADSA